jgi:hypothetical protein
MDEHDALQAVIGHILGHGTIGGDHASAKVFSIAFNG